MFTKTHLDLKIDGKSNGGGGAFFFKKSHDRNRIFKILKLNSKVLFETTNKNLKKIPIDYKISSTY